MQFIPFMFIGFSSGLTMLILFPIDIWLAENNISNTVIGLFCFCSLPYLLKFIIAPYIEELTILKKLPPKKTLIFTALLIKTISIIFIATINNPNNKITTLFCALTILKIGNAIQHIVSYYFQIDKIKPDDIKFVSLYFSIGYRIGLLITTSGTLILSHYYTWNIAFTTLAIISFLSGIIFFIRQEPTVIQNKESIVVSKILYRNKYRKVHLTFLKYLYLPLKLFKKTKYFYNTIILLILIKSTDAILFKFSKILFLIKGFSKVEIAEISNMIGAIATVTGGILVTHMQKYYSVKKSLYISFCIHILSYILFVLIYFYLQEKNLGIFILFSVIKNLTGGMIMSSLITLLHIICLQSGSQSFLYTSLYSLKQSSVLFFSFIPGIILDIYGYETLFLISILFCFITWLFLYKTCYKNVFLFSIK